MTYTVHIKITNPDLGPERRLLLDESIILPDNTFGITLKEINSLIRDMKEVAE